MEKLYSKVDPDVLLHIIVDVEDFNQPRNEIVPATEFIQGAAMTVNSGHRFRPHKHIWKVPINHYSISEVITQECWIVIKGEIMAVLYDIDDTIIATPHLRQGDACFSLHGGHTFESLEDGTCVWELKTGPYEGRAKDKVFIDE